MPPTVSTELLDALTSIGVPEDKARAAAAAVLGVPEVAERLDKVDQRFNWVDQRVNDVDTHVRAIDVPLGKIETELTLHRWAFGVMLALQAGIFIKLLWPHA
jgi:hypothetical protein